jgi:7-cyano-7-deazaguanine reductase
LQGAQKARGGAFHELPLQVLRNDEVEAQRRRWIFYEAIVIRRRKFKLSGGAFREGKMAKMTRKTDLGDLTLLGRKVRPVKKLETFPNHHPGRDYTVTLRTDEFTCVCPKTGQPDFAKLTIQYIPDRKIVESKSLKLYLWSYRSEGVFHEHGVNGILDDLVAALSPRWCKVTGEFAVRGGIAITVEAEYKSKG